MPRRAALPLCLALIFILNLLCAGITQAAEKPLVYFGINLRYSPRTMYLRYQPLMDYLSANTPYRFELKISHDYRDALDDFKHGRASVCSLGDGAFMDAILKYGAIPIVRPLNGEGRPYSRAVIVVPKDSPISSLKQLPGKTFAFGFSHSLTGNLLPRLMLNRAGVDVADLKYQVNLKNQDAVTKAILRGVYDAGSIKESFAFKYQQYGLRAVAYSAPIPSVPLVARPDTPLRLRESVASALLRLDPGNPADRRIMAAWDDEFRNGFAPASTRDYRDVSRLYQSIPNGCGLRCH